MSYDSSLSCQIKRSDRPCLVCSGYMDLIEARPNKFSLFSGIPLVCSTEGIDCLDCPGCGFKTTTADYQYLRMCKSDRQGKGMFINCTMNPRSERRNYERTRRRPSGQRRDSSSRVSFSGSSGRVCSSCQAPLDSNSWHFCPTCGHKCPPLTPVSASSRTTKSMNDASIPPTIPKDIVVTDDNSSSNDNNDLDTIGSPKPIDSESIGSGIVRMVTPPQMSGISTVYDGPVEMQY